jgi:prophage DNA circulation protein
MAADIFNLCAKITLDTSGYEQALKNSERQTNMFVDVLKANLASGAIISGVKKLANVVSDVGKAAYTNYAQYEQLAGGAELMFGDAYDFVAQKAKNAYKTVQMSQNNYLQQVNGFATGLKTALDGNAQAAAELADKVITAEADVVAATGNSQEAVQNAFNGIMKSNYTMLDNLQLGITPTKEGFQQLIDTVNEWNEENGKATEYTIDNLADCQAALVDYIDMQGLAGYAANEAADTIEGSTASMKAAWENLATGMADNNADMTELVQDFVDSVFTAGKNIVPRVKQIVTGVGTATTEAISYLRETNSTIDLVVTAIEDVTMAAATAGAVLVANMAGNAVRNIATIFTANATALEYFTVESGKAAVQEATLNGVFSVSEIAVGVLTGKISLATAAQYAWNTAMNANPIGLMAVTIAGAAVATKKLADASKDQIKALAGQAETIEDARQKYADLKSELEELENGSGGWTYERIAHIHGLKQAIKEVEDQIAEFEQTEAEAAEEAAKPANVFKAATEEYAAAAQSILEDYQNTYTTIYNGLHDTGSAFTDVVEATKISWADAMANIKANTAVLGAMDENFAFVEQAAEDSGVSIDGFSQYLASMSTEDAAGLLAALRSELEKVGTDSAGAKDTLTELSSAIESYKNAGTEYSDGLALAVENVKSRMQEAADSYVEKVGDLDQESAAMQAATNTMNGLISGISNSTSGVLGKLDSLASQMKSRLTNSFKNFTLTIKANVEASNIPKAKSGLDYVPYDEYLCYLHEGEAVLTKAEARLWRARKSANATSTSVATDENTSSGKSRGMTIIQNIQAVVQSEVELAAATEAYFTQARWAM